MKLRQKLAMVLAAAMIVTAVPVVTMAASTNSFNKTVSIVKDSKLDVATGLSLELRVDRIAANSSAANRTFFINAEDFKFDKVLCENTANTPGVTITHLSDTQIKVVIADATTERVNTTVSVPVLGQVNGEMPTLTVDGYDSLVSSGTYVIGSGEAVTDKALTVSAGTAGKISIEGYGKLGTITINETVAGSSNGKTINVELPRRSELVFGAEGDIVTLTAKGTRGLANMLITGTDNEITAEVTKEGRGLEIQLPGHQTGAARGSVELTNIQVFPKDARKDCTEGEVSVTVSAADAVKLEEATVVVGQVTATGITVETTEDFAIEAGRATKELEIKIKENSVDTFSGRNFYVNIDGAKFIDVVSSDKATVKLVDGELVVTPVATADADTITIKVNVHAYANTEGDITLTMESKDLEENVARNIED